MTYQNLNSGNETGLPAKGLQLDVLSFDAMTLSNMLYGVQTLIEGMPMHPTNKALNKNLSSGLAVLEVSVMAAEKLMLDLEEAAKHPAARGAVNWQNVVG